MTADPRWAALPPLPPKAPKLPGAGGPPFNATVARLTLRGLLGRRRVIFLLALPGLLLGLAVLVRVLAGRDDDLTVAITGGLGVALFVPLLGVIAGTGAIGPEIDDGSIVYLLAKPLSRRTIAVTKALVAIGVIAAFAALPVLIAGLVMSGTDGDLALGFFAGALAASIAYGALFLMLGVVTRNAVLVGLIYAVVWETLVGSFVPGAKALSIAQWSGSITESIVGTEVARQLDIDAAVSLGTGLPLLLIVTIGSVWYAGERLRSLRMSGEQ
ncbi:MAG: ABC transporter permease [Sporichthyaceae bacterium]